MLIHKIISGFDAGIQRPSFGSVCNDASNAEAELAGNSVLGVASGNRFLNSLFRIFFTAGCNHEELISAVAHQEVILAAGELHSLCRKADRHVAGFVAVLVVDDFQVVHIREKDLNTTFRFKKTVIFLLAEALQTEAIVKAGQAVVDVQIVEDLIELPQQTFFPNIFKGDLKEIEKAFVFMKKNQALR